MYVTVESNNLNAGYTITVGAGRASMLRAGRPRNRGSIPFLCVALNYAHGWRVRHHRKKLMMNPQRIPLVVAVLCEWSRFQVHPADDSICEDCEPVPLLFLIIVTSCQRNSLDGHRRRCVGFGAEHRFPVYGTLGLAHSIAKKDCTNQR
jgi:hypothetical protein